MTATEIARTRPGTAAAALESLPPAASVTLLSPIASPEELLEAQNLARRTIAKALKEGRDYGKIPGTERPILFQAGALRLCTAYGIVPEYRIAEREVDHDREVEWVKRSWKWGQAKGEKIWSEERGVAIGIYRYAIECRLTARGTGELVATALGVASTLESKYTDRPRDLEHVIQRMATKRALVTAVVAALGLADEFEVEDTPAEEDEIGRLVKPLREMIAELQGMDGEQAIAVAEELEFLLANDATPEELRKLGARTLPVIKRLRAKRMG